MLNINFYVHSFLYMHFPFLKLIMLNKFWTLNNKVDQLDCMMLKFDGNLVETSLLVLFNKFIKPINHAKKGGNDFAQEIKCVDMMYHASGDN